MKGRHGLPSAHPRLPRCDPPRFTYLEQYRGQAWSCCNCYANLLRTDRPKAASDIEPPSCYDERHCPLAMNTTRLGFEAGWSGRGPRLSTQGSVRIRISRTSWRAHEPFSPSMRIFQL